jgi:hypothetical protein
MMVIFLSGAISVQLVILTVLLPGGVTLDTYRQFVTVALPQVAQPADALVIGSPAFTAATLAYSLGAPSGTVNLVANIATAIVLIVAAFWIWQRADRPIIEIAAGWGVWAMVALAQSPGQLAVCRNDHTWATNRPALDELSLRLTSQFTKSLVSPDTESRLDQAPV